MKIEILLAPRFFQPMEIGELNFHVYTDMGPVQKGDVCVFKEYDTSSSHCFTGRTLEREVTWVQPLQGKHGVTQVLGLKPLREVPVISWELGEEGRVIGKCSLGNFVIEKFIPSAGLRNVLISKAPTNCEGYLFHSFEEAKEKCEETLSNGRS